MTLIRYGQAFLVTCDWQLLQFLRCFSLWSYTHVRANSVFGDLSFILYLYAHVIMNIEKGLKIHKFSSADLNESQSNSVKKIFSIVVEIAHTAVQLCSKRNLNPTFEVRFWELGSSDWVLASHHNHHHFSPVLHLTWPRHQHNHHTTRTR